VHEKQRKRKLNTTTSSVRLLIQTRPLHLRPPTPRSPHPTLLLFAPFRHCLALTLWVLRICCPFRLPGDSFHLSTQLGQLPHVAVNGRHDLPKLVVQDQRDWVWPIQWPSHQEAAMATSISLVLVASAIAFFICFLSLPSPWPSSLQPPLQASSPPVRLPVSSVGLVIAVTVH